jgi:hypothetical protein
MKMKNVAALFLACALFLVAAPAALPQARLDIGGIFTKEIDITTNDKTRKNVDDFLDELPVLPLPEISLRYQKGFGLMKLDIGARAFSLIAESIVWPEACAELDFGRASIEARVGGGVFAMFGILNRADFGRVFIPDLSAWLMVGKEGSFRLGVGAAGLYVPETMGNSMTVLIYLGGKTSIVF